MHYYQFHIGDYKSHTHHLSLMEDCAYRRLLDFYYLNEKPINQRDVARQIGMREHEQDVLTVLNEFFISAPEGFIHPRADREIAKYKEFAEAGKRGAAKRWSTPPQQEANGEANSPPNPPPIATINHKPVTINHINTPDGVDDLVWQDFVAMRKKKRATVTDRVIEGLQKEAEIAGWSLNDALKECVVRGWQAFKAEWVAKPVNKADQVFTTVPSRFDRDPALIAVEQKLKEAVPMPPEIREYMARLHK
jgi:uncharacterized protein YdaU (DUF1376 family)